MLAKSYNYSRNSFSLFLKGYFTTPFPLFNFSNLLYFLSGICSSRVSLPS